MSVTELPQRPGRSCPLSYRYAPAALAGAPAMQTETLYVVGGLYGNEPALDAILTLFETEPGPKHLIFNGDFNWFDIAPERFSRINETVLGYDALRGNVETELNVTDGEAGCGCGYPDWVDDGVVQRSNAIMRRLATTASTFPALRTRLAALPMFRRIEVGGTGIGVVHGDAESLAGWGFSQENLADPSRALHVGSQFSGADVRIFASSHTCLPVLQRLSGANGRDGLIANNGAAGMPNFAGETEGLITRIATTPCPQGLSRYGTRLDDLHVDAVGIRYDQARWRKDFLSQWPAGSDAHASYWRRITEGPAYRIAQAMRY